MDERVGLYALGGHTSAQQAAFRKIMDLLDVGYEFFGPENAFEAHTSGNMYELSPELLEPSFAGFYAGATRATLVDEEDNPIPENLAVAIDFIKESKLDYLVASAGDDQGMQMQVLGDALEAEGIDCKVLVLSKTMDGDKGGVDGQKIEIGGITYTGPFADTTSGFHTAIEVGTERIQHSLAGAWTNEVLTIVPHFAREANWVNAALSWYGNADIAVFGELPEDHEGHSLDKLATLAKEAMQENKAKYGRRFATMVVTEATKIEGINSVLPGLEDVHGNNKYSPALLAVALKIALEEYGIKTQDLILTYELRNHPPSKNDIRYGREIGIQIANAIRDGKSGMEAVLKYERGKVISELVPISLGSAQRLTGNYPNPLYDSETLKPLPEVGGYFKPMFGERVNLETLLPGKPTVVNIFNP